MNQDFKVMNMFSRIVDLIFLNFLFLVTSLPIVTLGASLSALYSVNLKLVRNEESYISRDFFHAFKENFVHSTIAFFIFALGGGVLCANILISYKNPASFYIVLRTLSFIFLASLGICFLYFYPILARFRFTFRQIWMHIPHMIVTHPAEFAMLVVINLPVLFLCLYSVYTAAFVLILGCLFGFSLFTYAEASLFRKIFEPYELR